VCRLGFEHGFNSQCTACTTGKFRGSNLTRLCTACPQDAFQDASAQLSCLSCPHNSSTHLLHGRSTIRDCVCGAGFQPLSLLDSHTGVCQPCAAGTFRTSRMQNESEAPCMPCPEDHYCPLGITMPVSCPRGEVSDASARAPDYCQCPPGFGRESHASESTTNESHVNFSHPHVSRTRACTLCALGSFSATRSNDACLSCPENKTTYFVGASNQTACTCVSGHGVDTFLPSAPCSPCPSATFAAGNRNAPCLPCGWGTVTIPFALPVALESCTCNANLGVHVTN
jgi:hypothetical protein